MNDREPDPRQIAPWLQWMPMWLEFCIVFVFTLGPYLYSSLSALFTILPDKPINQEAIYGTIVLELLTLAVIAPLLAARGWTLTEFGFRFAIADIWRGILLTVIALGTSWLLGLLLLVVAPDSATSAADVELVGSKFTAFSVLAAAIVNPVFEELILSAYLIGSLRPRFGVTVAINVSVLVRLGCHLYQGPTAIVGIVPLGLIYAYSYARTRRLWPLIVAHAIQDALALSAYIDGMI